VFQSEKLLHKMLKQKEKQKRKTSAEMKRSISCK